MTDPRSPGTVHSFVVRLWEEAPGRWRGRVEHLRTGQVAYVEDARALERFLARWVGTAFFCSGKEDEPWDGGEGGSGGSC